MRSLLLVLAALVLPLAGPVAGHTIHVSSDGSGYAPTIQAMFK